LPPRRARLSSVEPCGSKLAFTQGMMHQPLARRVLSVVALTVGCFAPASRADPPDTAMSFAAANVAREHKYRVDARVRPLLFWLRKTNIGDGRITWRTGPDGTVGYDLLVGTDPARTPRRINRWGYLREESGPQGAFVFGIMSKSDEQSVQDADRNTGRAGWGGNSFMALHQQATSSEARVKVSLVQVANDPTYAELETLLAAVPAAPSRSKTVPLGSWTSPGFLAATATLLEEGRLVAAGSSRSARPTRLYPYNGQLYELQLLSAERLGRFTHDGRSFGAAIRGDFRVMNGKTGAETAFTVVYGVNGDLTGVPVFISFRPRWWLEVNCVLADSLIAGTR
jgi:hypothetical protein